MQSRLIYAGEAAVILAGLLMGLGACAQPDSGVAATGSSGYTITDTQLDIVSTELTQIGVRASRMDALRYLVAVHEGGREALEDCPQISQIQTPLYQIPEGDLSSDSHEVMQLLLCGTLGDAQTADELGMQRVDSELTQKVQRAFQAGQDLQNVTLSPRITQELSQSKETPLPIPQKSRLGVSSPESVPLG